MGKNLPSDPVDIRPFRERLISAIENSRESGCDLANVMEKASDLKKACRGVLILGEQHLIEGTGGSVGIALPFLEDAYINWKAVNRCFAETSRLAFTGMVPRRNLLLDDIHVSLKNLVGEPLSALYTRARTRWNGHLEHHPWDAFIDADTEHHDQEAFTNALEALSYGDDLDVEDAIEELTGALRHLFAAAIEEDRLTSSPFAVGLWKRPEIVVANDYWRGRAQSRILDVLAKSLPNGFNGSFAKVVGFFEESDSNETRIGIGGSNRRIINGLAKSNIREREKLLRCLMLHPDNEVRRYAAANVDIGGFWKVVTPQAVPCATILSQLEQVVGTNRFDENLRKVFFNALYRRLLYLTSRSEVLYARGIIRILMQLDFLMEDSYFEKLVAILDYLEIKEKLFGVKDSLLDDYAKKFREDKRRVGPRESEAPDFQAIPPVVLRKLARDGHFWYELSMHPIYKVARETISHINTTDRGYRIATNHNTNQEVLRAIGKRRSLFSSLRSKLALLSNPRTPPTISMDYVTDLTKADIESLLRRSSIHPELRQHLMKKYKR
ncbi:MAG: hypothetical protein GTO51_07925 [Candidatus Latescibacteria bacterium]|nr:hypothetical protein [Candidatus Latescibacterota bacterium]NIM21761.1 hypothetical protein [Candidatus Latescibacterota bacterium]NIM65899.1 hypothetical protein [Candidatus Latescibacterota bacterium]NIO02644.1 hypothetical protein [Candidatus Latescibacterota bacterium]NIO29625.1 hypothetical protein [Candidatus Latescibacterota bacterium]